METLVEYQSFPTITEMMGRFFRGNSADVPFQQAFLLGLRNRSISTNLLDMKRRHDSCLLQAILSVGSDHLLTNKMDHLQIIYIDLPSKNGEFPVRYVSLPGRADFQVAASVLDAKEIALWKTPGPTVPVKARDDAGKMGIQKRNF